MKQILYFILLFVAIGIGYSQDNSLPADLRQHALTEYNSSLFNPAFSLDRNNPQSVSLWTRWQWQTIDADPTTLFFNYTRKIGDKSALGAGFIQQNTGLFFNTGGVINYAHEIRFSPLVKLSFGANLFGYNQELANDVIQIDPDLPIPGTEITSDFIIQFAPGINISVENFSFGFASENLFDYNFSSNQSNTVNADKIFMGMVSYDFPVVSSDPTAFLRPSIYMRTIPEEQNQIGVNALFKTKKYWAQSGYNNFYGVSVGAGGTFFNRFSIGGLVEFGTSGLVSSEDPTFELVASFFIGNPEERRKEVAYGTITESASVVVEDETLKEELKDTKRELEKTKKELEEARALTLEEGAILDKEVQKQKEKEAKAIAAQEKIAESERRKDSIAAAKKQKQALALAEKNKIEEAKKAEITAANAERQKEQDRLAALKKEEDAKKALAEAKRLEQQRKTDSINEVKRKEALVAATPKEAPEIVTPKAGEKYEEVATEGNLEPGYYLIANVFGTKKYFDAFMNDLRKKGLQPKSFFRTKNNYNYAYLERYNTISEARRARDSKFGGLYTGKTWIFRVIGE